ncbi:zinc ABC transporter substrate-binding protein AztC [Aminobacter sp. BE322]|uniref:zinc ABC transporter substrate-binding protein AztC n=1 Tax=unclassified Aminobacter TaxID=2644704 RepID=UPI003D242A83
MHRLIGLASALTVITLISTPTTAFSAEPLKVVASFSIIGDFARNVGGDRIELTTLVGPDGDAHVYEPSPADAVTMSKADVVLVNGLQFEGFLQRLVEASATKASIVELTKGIEPLKMKEAHSHEQEGTAEDGHHDGFDPHAFQSSANAKIYVSNIAGAFCAADAAGCDAYKANAARYTAELSEAEAYIKASVEAIPADKRTIITSHDAFGYFENAYGVTFLAPEGISTEAEASAADVAALIRQVREDKASAIFVENITNPRLVEQIAAETGVTVGGTLYSDALSKANGPAPTYIDLMKNNIGTIKGAILGS